MQDSAVIFINNFSTRHAGLHITSRVYYWQIIATRQVHEQEVVIIKVIHFYPTSCLEHNNYSQKTKLIHSHFHLCNLLCISVYQLPKHRGNMMIMLHILDLNRLILLLVSICDKYPWHYDYIPWKAKLYSLSCTSFGVYQ